MKLMKYNEQHYISEAWSDKIWASNLLWQDSSLTQKMPNWQLTTFCLNNHLTSIKGKCILKCAWSIWTTEDINSH